METRLEPLCRSAGEVVRAALRILEREERRCEAKLAGLRTAIKGDTSGVAKGNVFERVRDRLKLPLTPAPQRLTKKREG